MCSIRLRQKTAGAGRIVGGAADAIDIAVENAVVMLETLPEGG